MSSSRHRHAGPDDGAALVIALAFVTGVGLLVAALLSYGSANIRASAAMRERMQTDYTVDGALQTAVNTIRTNGYDNAPGEQCFTGSGTFAYTGDTTVVCTPQPGSGAAGGQTRVDERNRPSHALLALGRFDWFQANDNGGESGIGQLGTNTLRVRGDVHTNAGIAQLISCAVFPLFPCARLQQDDPEATVSARRECRLTAITSPGGKDCDADLVEDPGKAGEPRADSYAQPEIPTDATVFTKDNTPSCNSAPGSTVSLRPGVYTDSKPLNDLTNCTQKVIHFAPGVYFLDFRNGERGQSAAGGTDSKVFKVNNPNATIVGGTPQGWSPGAATKPAITVPGSCVSPLTSTRAGTGVQFVLGGDSRIEVRAGTVELCGQWRSDRPPIVIYGARSDLGATSGTGTHAEASSTTTPAFTGLGRLRPDDGDEFATAAFNNGFFPSAKLTTAGFRPASAPPVGSTLRSATLTVRERVRATRSGLLGWKFTVSLPTGSQRKDVALSTSSGSSWRTSTTDLLTTDLADRLAAAVADGTFTGLNVVFEANAGLGVAANADVEAVGLELAWIPPRGIRGEKTPIDAADNCVGTAPYLPVLNVKCALLKTSGSSVRLNVAGTVYAPLAAVNVGLSGSSRANFRWGVVVRSFRTDFSSWNQADESMIELPEDATGPTELVVHLSAYRCVASAAACAAAPPPSAAWRAAGQAKVTYGAAADGTTAGRKVDVDAWRVMR
jgi:hypothetical protein